MAKKPDIKKIQRDGDAVIFAQRLERLGFKQTEIALLLKKSARLINYYVHGERNIPAKIWVELTAIENMTHEEICQRIVKARK